MKPLAIVVVCSLEKLTLYLIEALKDRLGV
jgi:hypothetical protein